MTNHRKKMLKDKRYRFQWINLICLSGLIVFVAAFFISFNLWVLPIILVLVWIIAKGIQTIREINRELNA